MKNAIIYTIIFASIQFVMGGIVMGVFKLIGLDPIGSVSLITGSILSSILAFALFIIYKWAEVSPHWLRTRPWTVLLWTVVASLGALTPSIWLQEMLPELPNVAEKGLESIMGNRLGYVVIGLLAPLVEELVFRGAILRSLLRWHHNHWVAIAISALLFALTHVNPAQMPHAFLIGMLLGWMYYRTDSIIPGVVYHWANNSVAYVMYNISIALYGTGDPTLEDMFGSSVLLSVGFSLLIMLPAIYQLNLRMKK
ncbi:CPBP family intramembrane glutamic endopeptidase [Prevotella sp. P6B4]|uniref:CPBP family intramembrane glutamic endopeptidase n=1 Tax=Prevotella sp. P6B4 TaxID=1410614 RepID=UPI00048E8B25|nr:type II CAAX endopeptidase family protein [Prevotella sp. P6B4]